MIVLSAASKSILYTCVPEIIVCVEAAIETQIVDFSVNEGHRSVARQQKLFAQGRTEPGQIVTYIDGIKKIGEHNRKPSKAVDLVPWIPGKGKSWDDLELFFLIAGVMLTVAKQKGIKLEWGGHWKSFKDYPHFQVP